MHSFEGAPSDGAYPYDALTLVGDTFYGMTYDGGAYSSGTIFSIDIDGSNYEVLYSFNPLVAPGPDGDGGFPFISTFTSEGNTLYGVTYLGGDDLFGTIFKIDIDGSNYEILHSFEGTPGDGRNPYGPMTLLGNTLYGVTDSGGTDDWGTIFSIDTDGSNYQILYSFEGGPGDGAYPFGELTVDGNTLYGTTYDGGGGFGTIFSIDTDGSNYETVYTFGGTNGDSPNDGLVLIGDTLYGTTYTGGASGAGVIFSVKKDGTNYRVLHTFEDTVDDGGWPYAPLLLVDDVFYGTTINGGTSNDGVIFSIKVNGGNYKILHSFDYGPPGEAAYPYGRLVIVNDTLYGVTESGGADYLGTIFSFSLPPPIEISSCAEFEAIGDDLTADYVLTQDIDCAGYPNFIPIGFDVIAKTAERFTGSLDGAGYTISNLHMDRASFALLYSIADWQLTHYAPISEAGFARIENITFRDGSVAGSGRAGVAGVLGYGEEVSFENVHVVNTVLSPGTLSPYSSTGGILGETYEGATFDNVSFSGDISSRGEVGGIVGQLFNDNGNSSINNAVTSGSITSTDFAAGGIGGFLYSDDDVDPMVITNSSSIMDVVSSYSFAVGGLIGYGADGIIIEDSFATGNVESTSDGAYAVGGLIGYSGDVILSNVYATGNVTALGLSIFGVGGLVGAADYGPYDITNSYSTGVVTVGEEAFSVGGLVGVAGLITIQDSHSSSSLIVANEGDSVGGLVGWQYEGGVSNSYSTGDITVGENSNYVGGLIGWLDESTINSTFSISPLTLGDGTYHSGGLVGYLGNGSLISNSYSTLDFTLNTRSMQDWGESGIGGLVGDASGSTIQNSYATSNVTVTSSDPAGIGTLMGYAEGFGDTVTISNTFTASSVSPTIADISQYGK
jgi:uncharacterized repeat protein (TIGR03803 family)